MTWNKYWNPRLLIKEKAQPPNFIQRSWIYCLPANSSHSYKDFLQVTSAVSYSAIYMHYYLSTLKMTALDTST